MVWWVYDDQLRDVWGPFAQRPKVVSIHAKVFKTEGTMAEEELRTKKTPHMIRHMLAELETPKLELTAWERQFIESITDQFNRRSDLSDKQFRVLERIYAEKTA